MKAADLNTPLLETYLAMQRIGLRAAAICSATTAEWLGVCAKHATELNAQALDAAGTLSGLLGQGENVLAADSKGIRARLDAAHRAYQDMLDAFRSASEAFAQTPALTPAPTVAQTNKRTRA